MASRPAKVLLSALLPLLLLVACGKPAPTVPPGPVTTPPVERPPVEQPPQEPARTIDWWMEQLTLEEKVGQLFWFGLPGSEVSPEATALVKAGQVGGFILFARNVTDADQVADLTTGLQRVTFERGRPTPGLVISIDQEGGLVERLPAPFTSWPGAMAIGATGNPSRALDVGSAIAQELKAVGINMNMAPDADVNNNPANPVIGVRSFGSDPAKVGEFVTAAVKGTQAESVSAVAKHFPGHGDTGTDSHLALPVIHADRQRLDQVELVPFRAAIAADIDAIMVAHIAFPAIEPDGLPATLSKRIITDLLKGELGFQGVAVTDAIDTMKAVTDHYGKAESFVMAVQAGADALLVTESFGEQATLYDAVLQAVRSGQISKERLDDAVRRNLALKARRGLLPAEGAQAPVVKHPVAIEAHQQLANDVGAEALTIVRGGQAALQLAPNASLLVIVPSTLPVGPDGLTALGRSLKQVHANLTEIRIDRTPTAEQAEAVRRAASTAGGIVWGSDWPNQATRALMAEIRISYFVGLSEPYELASLPAGPGYLAAYGYRAPNLQAVGPVLFGQVQAKGRLPVTLQ